MTRRRYFSATVITAGLLCLVPLPTAQTPQSRSLYDRYTEPIHLYTTGLGTFTRPISTTTTEAQAFFDQGFQMMFAFAVLAGGRGRRRGIRSTSPG